MGELDSMTNRKLRYEDEYTPYLSYGKYESIAYTSEDKRQADSWSHNSITLDEGFKILPIEARLEIIVQLEKELIKVRGELIDCLVQNVKYPS
tara:strand:+ start:1186 stop:1464 length:279 start_codon:yes stop_codon:yes gene_type:complete